LIFVAKLVYEKIQRHKKAIKRLG